MWKSLLLRAGSPNYFINRHTSRAYYIDTLIAMGFLRDLWLLKVIWFKNIAINLSSAYIEVAVLQANTVTIQPESHMKQSCIIVLMILNLNAWPKDNMDLQVVTAIKSEAFENSHVMKSLFYLTDLYGPRLTNSPNYRAAALWCVEKLTEWGLQNARLEPWGVFGRGWSVDSFTLEMLEPQYLNMIAYPKAWTAGTDGTITGSPIVVDINSERDLERYRGRLRDAIVLLLAERKAAPHFEADARRFTTDELAELAELAQPAGQSAPSLRRQRFRKRLALRRKIVRFFKNEGVAVWLQAGQRAHGTMVVHRGGAFATDADPSMPQLVVVMEHYWRIIRLLQHDIPVKLRLHVATTFHSKDSLGYNVVAEIAGTDKRLKNELVMLGGHLDSWHAGTGATDNAAGCAVAMEAVRIIQTLGLQPRRTIRIALWGGEEQGLLGSKGYVKKHFGDKESMALKPAHANFSAYFNLDNGTGKIRGIYLQGNDAAKPIFEAFLLPFHDLGARTVTIRNTGGTDHLSFDAIGLPGFQFIQDPLDYPTRTHHTNMDVYDHIQESDLMQASVIMAAFVYQTAMRPEKIPRKPLPKPAANTTNGR